MRRPSTRLAPGDFTFLALCAAVAGFTAVGLVVTALWGAAALAGWLS